MLCLYCRITFLDKIQVLWLPFVVLSDIESSAVQVFALILSTLPDVDSTALQPVNPVNNRCLPALNHLQLELNPFSIELSTEFCIPNPAFDYSNTAFLWNL